MPKPPITITVMHASNSDYYEATYGRLSGLAGTAKAAANFVAKRYFEREAFVLTETKPGEFVAKPETAANLFE